MAILICAHMTLCGQGIVLMILCKMSDMYRLLETMLHHRLATISVHVCKVLLKIEK